MAAQHHSHPQPVATFSSREFAHDLAGVKRAAQEGPVFITDRGTPTYALMKIEDFRRLANSGAPARSFLEVMDALPGTAGIEFEPPRLEGLVKPADLDD
ncbi:type II toxin-antitoxin system prevent-host-death family antitoxin [Caenimonas koreensis DSM 17982]|uniref:Type II toxin-antitoxin system prevent-host-death family antitoxin n=1 Tax=Caenimonas koreensis DSM 17982 TaxID=1121255 RepID=A0A844B892_9BURK|nr:type II toxin-antitoxin system prevent-host-death family antitoxin [Caenimonas koreensis]MRD49372.1 type II toxin-antitoxin system prevent-host-death family antitoxin [Caenimonas koreensis DSM 17982]